MRTAIRRIRSRLIGASVVEFAVTAPLVVLLLFGAIEMGRAVMVQHMLQEVAQAGCRLYSVSDTTEADVQDIIDQAMQQSGIENYTVKYDPPGKDEVDESMEPVTVTVTADYNEVSWVAPFYMGDAVITGSCVMPADIVEGDDDDGGTKKETK